MYVILYIIYDIYVSISNHDVEYLVACTILSA